MNTNPKANRSMPCLAGPRGVHAHLLADSVECNAEYLEPIVIDFDGTPINMDDRVRFNSATSDQEFLGSGFGTVVGIDNGVLLLKLASGSIEETRPVRVRVVPDTITVNNLSNQLHRLSPEMIEDALIDGVQPVISDLKKGMTHLAKSLRANRSLVEAILILATRATNAKARLNTFRNMSSDGFKSEEIYRDSIARLERRYRWATLARIRLQLGGNTLTPAGRQALQTERDQLVTEGVMYQASLRFSPSQITVDNHRAGLDALFAMKLPDPLPQVRQIQEDVIRRDERRKIVAYVRELSKSCPMAERAGLNNLATTIEKGGTK